MTREIIAAAMEVHSNLGPGLLESAYSACLAYELSKRGLKFVMEKPLPVQYKEVKLDCGYRLDLVLECPISPGKGMFSPYRGQILRFAQDDTTFLAS